MVEPQVELGAKDNVAIPLRADFVFHPERRGQACPSRSSLTDSCSMLKARITASAMTWRSAWLCGDRDDFRIWSLTWDDVEDRFKSSPDSAFENLLNHSPAKLGQLLAAQGLNSMLGLHESRNFELFVRFLTQPDHEAWGKYAALSAIALPPPWQ
jgi:hypothetical protein